MVRSRTARTPLLLTLGACLLVAAVLSWWLSGRRAPLAARPLPAALVAELDALQTKAEQTVPADDPLLQQLRVRLAARSRAELAALQGQAEAQGLVAQTTAACRALQGDALGRKGAAWYAAAGRRLAAEAVALLLRDAAAWARAGGFDRWVATLSPGTAAARGLEEVYGSLLFGIALPSGLLGADGAPLPALGPTLRVVFLQRWLAEAAALKGVELALEPSEERAYLRWKLERATRARPALRRAALERLRVLEPDDGPAAAWDEALRRLEAAPGPAAPGP